MSTSANNIVNEWSNNRRVNQEFSLREIFIIYLVILPN